MLGDESWQAHHDELRARLNRTGFTLGDKSAATEDRELAAAEFIAAWQEFCRHIKDYPDPVSTQGPR